MSWEPIGTVVDRLMVKIAERNEMYAVFSERDAAAFAAMDEFRGGRGPAPPFTAAAAADGLALDVLQEECGTTEAEAVFLKADDVVVAECRDILARPITSPDELLLKLATVGEITADEVVRGIAGGLGLPDHEDAWLASAVSAILTAPDPVLEAVERYRAAADALDSAADHEAFDGSPVQMAFNAAYRAISGGRLPVATSHAGAIAALRLAVEIEEDSIDAMTGPLMRSALGYLEGMGAPAVTVDVDQQQEAA